MFHALNALLLYWKQEIDVVVLPSVTCFWSAGEAGLSSTAGWFFCFDLIFSILPGLMVKDKRQVSKQISSSILIRWESLEKNESSQVLIWPRWSSVSYCFFKVSTDFFSNSSRAAINFFTLASKSSAPLKVEEENEAMLLLELSCWSIYLTFWLNLVRYLNNNDTTAEKLRQTIVNQNSK